MTIRFQDRRGAASLRYRNGPEICILCVNKSPIRYGFRAGPRAIRCSVDIASFAVKTAESTYLDQQITCEEEQF